VDGFFNIFVFATSFACLVSLSGKIFTPSSPTEFSEVFIEFNEVNKCIFEEKTGKDRH
jgi:hypothetical protein